MSVVYAVGIAWGVIGAAIDFYETALAYAKGREQFGRPIASFQLVQQKLVWMAQEITKAQLLADQQGNRLRNVSQPLTSRCVYEDAGNVIETHEHAGDFKEL